MSKRCREVERGEFEEKQIELGHQNITRDLREGLSWGRESVHQASDPAHPHKPGVSPTEFGKLLSASLFTGVTVKQPFFFLPKNNFQKGLYPNLRSKRTQR